MFGGQILSLCNCELCATIVGTAAYVNFVGFNNKYISNTKENSGFYLKKITRLIYSFIK